MKLSEETVNNVVREIRRDNLTMSSHAEYNSDIRIARAGDAFTSTTRRTEEMFGARG